MNGQLLVWRRFPGGPWRCFSRTGRPHTKLPKGLALHIAELSMSGRDTDALKVKRDHAARKLIWC